MKQKPEEKRAKRDQVIELLNRKHQRATYKAVATYCQMAPQNLMNNLPMSSLNSWVVAKKNGRPTGYSQSDLHPMLLINQYVISTKEELEDWVEENSR